MSRRYAEALESSAASFVDDEPDLVADKAIFEWPSQMPKPGIYEGVSFGNYNAWPAMRQSTVSIGDKTQSMRHMKLANEGRLSAVKETPSINFGSALHCFLLEPKRFELDYPRALPCCAKLKTGKNQGDLCGKTARHRNDDNEWFCGSHARANEAIRVSTCLTELEFERIVGAAETIKNHDVIKLMEQRGASEVSCCSRVDDWAAKCRLDRYAYGNDKLPPTIVDVKKIRLMRGTERELKKHIRECRYDIQASWYTSIMQILTQQRHEFVWLFVEEENPFDVIPYQASQEMLDVGYMKWRTVMDRWCESVKHGIYLGYSNGLNFIYPDEWEITKYGVQRES